MPDAFADTYALFAAVDGSRAYKPYFLDGQVATTALNLAELAYGLRRRGLAREVEAILPPLFDMVVEPPRSAIADAARFKAERLESGAKCSFVDAWGYATARAMGLPFLTGDEDFRGVPGVKFVKA